MYIMWGVETPANMGTMMITRRMGVGLPRDWKVIRQVRRIKFWSRAYTYEIIGIDLADLRSLKMAWKIFYFSLDSIHILCLLHMFSFSFGCVIQLCCRFE